MKKSKKIGIVIGIVLIIILGVSILFLVYKDNNIKYKVTLSIIEKNSPDRIVKVLKDDKEIEFDSIYYMDNVFLCSYSNPTIYKGDLKGEHFLKVILKNKKEVKANILKEE